MQRITLSDLRIHPSLNMLPQGALSLGVASKNAVIRINIKVEDDIPKEELKNLKLLGVLNLIITKQIARKNGPSSVIVVWKDNYVGVMLNNGKDFDDPEKWHMLMSASAVSDYPDMVRSLLRAAGVRNVALFLETDNGDFIPVATTREELLKWISEDINPSF